MKKKGFTLVELLAVIAILAILIIIALPNILEMFNKAKKDSFVNEVRSSFRSAQQKFISEGGTSVIPGMGTGGYYTNISLEEFLENLPEDIPAEELEEETEMLEEMLSKMNLNLSGRTDFRYMMALDSKGGILFILATDDTFSFRKTATFSENCNPESLKPVSIEKINLDDIDEPIDNIFNAVEDLMEDFASQFENCGV